MSELREVARFAVLNAEDVLAVFEDVSPGDERPRAAINAAWEFAHGAKRSKLQRVTALDAHRAAKDAISAAAKHAAHAAGDAAAAAYLHPFAKAEQVGHILRSAAHAACATELLAGSPQAGTDHITRAAARATPIVINVLRRYPPAPAGKSRVAEFMHLLDGILRSR
ncbi:MAG: exonuclease SbcC [Nocardiaceae bacterium]|nr:exonuclease SbcC [Nocardiaceae bacterium]